MSKKKIFQMVLLVLSVLLTTAQSMNQKEGFSGYDNEIE